MVRHSWGASSGNIVERANNVMYRTEVSVEAVGAADVTLVQGRRRSGVNAWKAVSSMATPYVL